MASELYSDIRSVVPAFISDGILKSVATGTLNIVIGDASGTLYGSGSGDLFLVDHQNVTISGIGNGDEIIVMPGTGRTEIQESDRSGAPDNSLLIEGQSQSYHVTADLSGDLIIDGPNGDAIVLDSMLLAPGGPGVLGVQSVAFTDGSKWFPAQLVQIELSSGTSAPDKIYGTSGSDVLDGHGGSDLLQGNGGGDTFVFNKGYGNLEVLEQDSINLTSDVLSLGSGISASDITVTSDAAGDLILNVDGSTNGSIKVDGMLTSSTEGLGAVDFADGTIWTRQQLLTMANTGSALNTTITSMLPNQVVDPAGFAHSVNLAGGNSVVEFGLGYGQVEINQVDPNGADQNTLVFKTGIDPSDV